MCIMHRACSGLVNTQQSARQDSAVDVSHFDGQSLRKIFDIFWNVMTIMIVLKVAIIRARTGGDLIVETFSSAQLH